MRRAERGFTLVEILVTLVIASLLLVIILDGAATARERQRVSRVRREAVRLGQSILTQAAAQDVGSMADHGREAGLEWKLTEQAIDRDIRGYYRLDEIRVDVSLPKGAVVQSFITRKLRLAAAAP